MLQFSLKPNNEEYKLLELPSSILESLNTGNRYLMQYICRGRGGEGRGEGRGGEGRGGEGGKQYSHCS